MIKQLSVLAMAAASWAQSPAFDVASVRPANAETKGMNIRRDPAGGFTASNVNLRTLIVLAYNIQDYQLSGAPGWIASERYDVIAKARRMPKRATPGRCYARCSRSGFTWRSIAKRRKRPYTSWS